MVEQDVVLFRDTVLNNIRVGRPDATREEVLAAAEAARCGQFVCRLENGYDTVLAENGRSLSGGERQRISIARAILKDAPLLLLDEATASLDPENEGLVQQALSALLKQGKTVVVVAHRLSTIEDADQIIVIENGQVKEKGRHDDLMRIDGTYRKLYDLQRSAAGWSVSS
jgi:ATP-binding cassette subfamily B protein